MSYETCVVLPLWLTAMLVLSDSSSLGGPLLFQIVNGVAEVLFSELYFKQGPFWYFQETDTKIENAVFTRPRSTDTQQNCSITA